MTVKRFDRGELQKPERKDNGWVRLDGYISRIGIQEYMQTDGTVRREFRPAEEVFNQDTLESFTMVPLTNDHPAEGYLDATNTKNYQVGTVEVPQKDGERTRARMLVTDLGAIEDVMSGRKTQVSCGYSCDLEETSGEWNGQRYDAIQRNIRGNHVALVCEGRAGPEVRVRVDSKELTLDITDSAMYDLKPKGTPNNMTVLKIDGIPYEVSESAALAFAKFEKETSEAVEQVKAEADRNSARADAAEAQVKELKAALEAAPQATRAEIQAELELHAKAKEILGADFKADGKDAAAIKREIAETVNGVKLEGKSEAYVAAAYDLAVERFANEGKAQDVLPHVDAKREDTLEDVRKKHREWLESLSKNAVSKGK